MGLLSFLGSFLAGILGGGVAGAVVSYYLQRRGRLTCVVSDWQLRNENGQTLSVDQVRELVETMPDHERIRAVFQLDVFNEKSINTGLRGLCINLSRDSKVQWAVQLRDARPLDRPVLDVLNLPAHTWTSLRLAGYVYKPGIIELMRDADIELVGYFPDGERFSHRIDPKKDRFSPIAPDHIREERRNWYQ